jgi:hypothetical protein
MSTYVSVSIIQYGGHIDFQVGFDIGATYYRILKFCVVTDSQKFYMF